MALQKVYQYSVLTPTYANNDNLSDTVDQPVIVPVDGWITAVRVFGECTQNFNENAIVYWRGCKCRNHQDLQYAGTTEELWLRQFEGTTAEVYQGLFDHEVVEDIIYVASGGTASYVSEHFCRIPINAGEIFYIFSNTSGLTGDLTTSGQMPLIFEVEITIAPRKWN